MANGYPPFIFHGDVEARQMENYANNAAKADLAKQENLFRMAELGLRRQQAQETAQLNQLITQSQLQQRQIENQFRERELSQRGELERERNQNYLKGLQIQFPEGRLTPEGQRQAYDAQLRAQEEQQEAGLAQQLETALADLDKRIGSASTLEKAPKRLEGQTVSLGDIAGLAINPIYGIYAASQLDYSGKRNVRNYLQKQLNREPTDKEISEFIKTTKAYRASPDTERLGALQQRRTQITDQLKQYGWMYDPSTKKIIRPRSVTASQLTVPTTVTSTNAPLAASALTAPAVNDPRIDAIKREAAAAIQAGANPAAVYQRMAEMGVDLR